MRLEIGHAQQEKANNSGIFDIREEERQNEASAALRDGIRAAQAGDRVRARTFLLRASELDPTSESAWLWLASISEYPEELLIFLNNVLEINPRNARANEWMRATKTLLAKTFVQRGIDAAEEGRNDFAVQFFNQALENDQTNANAWLWLAKLADSDEGRMNYLEKVLELDPDNDEARKAFAELKHKSNLALLAEARAAAVSGRKSDANELLDAFIAENPDSEDGWMLRAHLADAFDEKISAFESVLKINPDNLAAKSGLESLKAIMQTVMPLPAAPTELPVSEYSEPLFGQPEPDVDVMENIAFAIDNERELAESIVHDKSPTQELIFPEAAREMELQQDKSQNSETENIFSEEPIFFDDPSISVVGDVQIRKEPSNHPIVSENHEDNPIKDAENLDWSMNTVAFSFSFPAGEVKNDIQDAVAENAADDAKKKENDSISNSFGIDENYNSVQEFDFNSSSETPAYDSDLSRLTEIFNSANAKAQEEQQPHGIQEEQQQINDPDNESSNFEAASPFTEKVDFSQSGQQQMDVPEGEPTPFDYAVEPIENLPSQSAACVNDSIAEVHTDQNQNLNLEHAIPAPVDFGLPSAFPLAAAPTSPLHKSESHTESLQSAECPFCKSKNPGPIFTCNSCLAILTLSDLEMLLSNNHADRLVIRGAIEDIEALREHRELSESELTNLGIGYLNLREFQQGLLCLQEASRKNPDNVLLSGQVNSLLIRLEEISQSEVSHDPGTKTHSVLVVDDSATVRKLIVGKLEKSGYNVFSASDGIEALEMLKTITPDLILLDITMPRMDGYQVCKVIRGMESTKDTPVIMISGKDGFFDKVRGRMAGTTGYITKPFGPETLMKAIESYLHGSKE